MTLNEKDLKKVKQVGIRKTASAMAKIYNKLCHGCKTATILLTKRGSRVSLEHYCPVCKEKAEKILIKLAGKK